MKRRAPCRLNALTVAKLIRYLQDVPSNVIELAEACGLSEPTARRFVLALHREGATHVVGWEPDCLGRWVTKVYAIGQGVDMPKPEKSRTREKLAQSRRQRRAQLAIQNAISGVA